MHLNGTEVDCALCKTDLWLSMVVSRAAPGEAACPEHAAKLPGTAADKVSLCTHQPGEAPSTVASDVLGRLPPCPRQKPVRRTAWARSSCMPVRCRATAWSAVYGAGAPLLDNLTSAYCQPKRVSCRPTAHAWHAAPTTNPCCVVSQVLLVRHTPEELEAMVAIAVELIDGAAEAVEFARQRRELCKVHARLCFCIFHYSGCAASWMINGASTRQIVTCSGLASAAEIACLQCCRGHASLSM